MSVIIYNYTSHDRINHNSLMKAKDKRQNALEIIGVCNNIKLE